MKIIVDTSIWSLALRRSKPLHTLNVLELRNLIDGFQVQMLGPIRQEILSGIRDKSQFNKLQKYLQSFPDLPILTEEYVLAATFFNLCRSKGIQGSNTDFLICSVSIRNKIPIFTADKDFELFAKHIPIVLHKPEEP